LHNREKTTSSCASESPMEIGGLKAQHRDRQLKDV
jgi:hypothetical protein